MNAVLAVSSFSNPSFVAANSEADLGPLKSKKVQSLIEFQRLLQLASVNKVDITPQKSKIWHILTSDNKQQSSIKLMCEIAILQQCNEQISREIIRRQNQVSLSSSDASGDWKKQMIKFQYLVAVAAKYHIDVSEQAMNMKAILKMRVSANEPHQFKLIRDSYEIKMLQKYNREIALKLRFQRLVERAQKSRIEVSEEITHMQEVLMKKASSSSEPHQFKPIRDSDSDEMKLLQKYTTEIGLKLEFCRLVRRAGAYNIPLSLEEKALAEEVGFCNWKNKEYKFKSIEHVAEINQGLLDKITLHLRHALFHLKNERYLDAKCNSDFQWDKQMQEYLKLLKIAKEKQVDIIEERRKMQGILLDRPDSSEHQFTPIRVLYETQMLKKYNQEIARKIAQHGLFHTNQKQLEEHLQDQTEDVTSKFQEWVQRAQKSGHDVSTIVSRIEQMKEDLEPISNAAHQIASVRLLSANEIRKMYCIRIIRQMAEAAIRERIEQGRQNPSLQKHTSLINQSEKFLLKKLPHESKVKTIQEAEDKYRFIMAEMERMTASILARR